MLPDGVCLRFVEQPLVEDFSINCVQECKYLDMDSDAIEFFGHFNFANERF